MVKEIRGRSGVGNASAHGLAPQNLSPDKHVDVCVDSDEDRGSTPLASTFIDKGVLENGETDRTSDEVEICDRRSDPCQSALTPVAGLLSPVVL